MSDPKPAPAVPVPAATLLLVRDAEPGLEIFMVKRHHEIDFMPGAMVFPGGKLDPEDWDASLRPRCTGAEQLEDEPLAMRVGAIREAFEECGVLLARARGDDALVDGARLRDIDARYREKLSAGDAPMTELVEAEDLELACDRLVHFAHWITPERVPRRFDTHFFVVETPPDHVAVHDGGESVESVWISPAEAIAEEEAGRLTIIFPTLLNLKKLGASQTVAEALEAARTGTVVPVLPRVAKGEHGPVVRIPIEAGYGVSEAPVQDVPQPGRKRS